ncbi:unnamed protein product [Staurois parvus]|uniref:Uncharacterized protein n=1 Tax=Staurois parvus TaxID=386267 RepID=A0ABN9DF64_9NEOB|nr:unnamed protein product [Staurois parvus]
MYVKWFDTVMFYYVILVYLVNITFLSFSNFPPFRPPYIPTSQGWNPEDKCRHPPEDITGDTAGGTSRERRTR